MVSFQNNSIKFNDRSIQKLNDRDLFVTPDNAILTNGGDKLTVSFYNWGVFFLMCIISFKF